ncbi:MAG: HAMP domain-containing histidine kinase [Prolixibacteraceae bacterium]|nr:HAMP domain-containing histidine kinase [Prolixibacteraceae bacterium]
MKRNRYLRTPFLLFLVFLILGIVTENYVLTGGIKQQDIRRFTRNLHQKQSHVDKMMEDIALRLDSVGDAPMAEVFNSMKPYNELFEGQEMAILVTKNNRLFYWSDHVAAFYPEITNANEGFVQLPNGWFVISRKIHHDYVINGLILIKYNYQIENRYLRNTFAQGFHLPNDFEIHFYQSETSFPVYDFQNRFVFSLEPSGELPCIYSDLYIPVFLFLLSLIFLFVVLYRFNTHYWHRYRLLKLFLLLLLVMLMYWLMVRLNLPRSAYLLKVFTPIHFAYTSFWSSLGEFIVFSALLFFWGINFLRAFDLPETYKKKQWKRRLLLGLLMIFAGLFFLMIRFMIHTLIMNSSISFAVYRIEEISLASFGGFFSMGILLMAYFFVSIRIAQVFRKYTTFKVFLLILSLLSLLLYVFFRSYDAFEAFRLTLFFWLIFAAAFLVVKRNVVMQQLTVVVLFVLIFSMLMLTSLINFQEEHENRIQQITAMNLSAEHDPTAEIYLREIDQQIKSDTVLQGNLHINYQELENYLARKYFNGFLREYDLQLTFCHQDDSLLIQPENTMSACFPFFEDLVTRYGTEIPGTNFFYLDNMNGRVTYFGQFDFDDLEHTGTASLFIELNSRLLSEGKGFPELLLPDHSYENRIRNNFSFAKYNKGELVDRGGDFLYALTVQSYPLSDEELFFRKWDNYEHCIYALGNESYIMVSRPYIRFSDYLIAFPYIFVFLFILSLLVRFSTRPYFHLVKISGSLMMRIQLSIIGVVFVALLIVGSGTVLYNIAQYRANHRDDLIDKINSISVEIDLLLGDAETFNQELVEFLYYELIRISDIFWTDINLYDLNGRLLTTSRPEVFEKGLISRQMDNTAIRYLKLNQPTRYLHKEHIAKMEYLSAYVPMISYTGKNIGYINLPYFIKEKEFRQEITTFILAFINIYVFLLMASILVAYFISAKITEPLKMIRENLRIIQLGKTTQPIAYNSDDEIGTLVNEYNNKLRELANSADLLARSERETAWREMAKQIAHEIKNPLTPMKLNVQFLQRSVPEVKDDYHDKVLRVSEILIEQIDNLSAIATAFSNFAKIPRAHNEKFLLAERLYETLKLYNYTGQVEISTHFKGAEELMVYADQEQFSRAIINLIKNAIQSIPENQQGTIDISLLKETQYCVIKIADNGKGIPEALKDNVFVPNFTTKSSGAGLGLAITKNIVENFKGQIWFESEEGIGTVFYIRIPTISKG